MKFFKIFMIFLMFCFGSAIAESMPQHSVADIKIELIKNLKQDGYISDRLANEAVLKYVKDSDKVMSVGGVAVVANEDKSSSVNMKQYLSMINLIKVIGVILFLVAFSGIIRMATLKVWFLIKKVPVIIYQTVFLSCGLTGLIAPDLILESQAFYVALFSSFANIMIIGWIIVKHPKLQELLTKIFSFGIPSQCIVSFFGMIYFSSLAFAYQSSIFGFFAAVCLSGMLSFSIGYIPGVLFLSFKENMLNAVIWGHVIVLAIYVFLFRTNPQIVEYFNSGIQYYCTIALCVGLLVGSSPFYRHGSKALLYLMLFIVLFVLSSYGYFFYDLKVIGSIVTTFIILIALEWIGYLGFSNGLILGSTISGASLYGLSLLLEKYSSMIILTMN